MAKDFRSQNGLYTLSSAELSPRAAPRAKHIPGKDLFDASLWNDQHTTSAFYRFISSFRHKVVNDVKQASSFHKFIRMLRDSRRLVRCYTQNIDGLESREGLDTDMSKGSGSTLRFTKNSLALPYQRTHLAPGEKLDGGCEVVQLHGDIHRLRCTLCRNVSAWDSEKNTCYRQGQAPACPVCATEDHLRRAKGKRGSAVGKRQYLIPLSPRQFD